MVSRRSLLYSLGGIGLAELDYQPRLLGVQGSQAQIVATA